MSRTWIGLALLGSCDTVELEDIGVASAGVSKCLGGRLGDSNYCSATCKCVDGEGDCDSASDCVSGSCAGKGAYFYGIASNACAPAHCANNLKDADETQIDCGGSCGSLCPDPCSNLPANGSNGHCNTDCPCASGQGDCALSATRCQQAPAAQTCRADMGAAFGLMPSVDVCLPTYCSNGVLDADESGVDCGPSCTPCAGAHLQSKALGGTVYDLVTGVSFDATGNLIVVGSFSGTASAGGASLVSAGEADGFVAKFNQVGVHLWSARLGGSAGESVAGVAVDSASNIYVVGGFSSTSMSFRATALGVGNQGLSDLYVLKLDPNGNVLWTRAFGGPNDDRADAVAVRGDVFITGGIRDGVNFGGGVLPNAGRYDAYALRLSPAGAHVYSRAWGGAGNDQGLGIAADSGGNAYVAGHFESNVNFGTGVLTGQGAVDAFTLRLATTGSTLWARGFGGRGSDSVRGIAIDSLRRPTVVGHFKWDVDFGSGASVHFVGSTDAFILAYDVNGGYRWHRNFGSRGYDFGRAVVIGSNGHPVVTGDFTGTVDYGGGNQSAGSGSAAFVAGYDANNGGFLWGHSYGAGSAAGASIAVFRNTVAVAGAFSGNMSFGGPNIGSAGSVDGFFARYTN